MTNLEDSQKEIQVVRFKHIIDIKYNSNLDGKGNKIMDIEEEPFKKT